MSITIYVSSFNYRDECAENVNMTSMAYDEEKHAGGRPRHLTDSARKKHKRAQDKILIQTKVNFGDQYERWTKKKQELSETQFRKYVSNFISLSVSPLHKMT